MKFGEAEGGKPKPKGPLAALLAGGPSSDSSPDLEVDVEEEPDVDHGFRAVAKAFGIPPEREAAAQAALEHYIKACKGSDSDDDEEY